MKFQFAIDRGGTFTDVFVRRIEDVGEGKNIRQGTKSRVLKLLSEDPANYPDAPREAIRRVLEEELGSPLPQSLPVPTSAVDWIRMGTTVATNALLERKGERMALLITKGFKDLLFIGNQARPKIFDLEIRTPDVLYERVIEVDERVVLRQESCQLPASSKTVVGVTGESVEIWRRVDEADLRRQLRNLQSTGISAIAVVLLHSFIFPDHERRVGEIAAEMGFRQISLSHVVMPMVRCVPRGLTTAADAYLTPCIKDYVDGFSSGFQDKLGGVHLSFMKSDGGLTPMDNFGGSRAILSGPAGGVVGYAVTTYGREAVDDSTGRPSAVIGFDMGGTSTDVSRYDGTFEHTFETTTAGVAIQAPQLDINTVAAGGGSMLFFRSGMFVVGPESAGAHPGPVCYRKGGPVTVTDANLVLGRLLPQFFPKIFGPDENEALDYDGAVKAFQELTDAVNAGNLASGTSTTPLSVGDVAQGFIKVANEAMCRPIRALTQAKGYDTSRHVLACFGGAGGQHACDIASELGMKTVFVHRYAGILSAYGIALADVVHEAQEPAAIQYRVDNFCQIDERLEALSGSCVEELRRQGFADDQIHTEAFLHLRYEGTDCALMCSPGDEEEEEEGSRRKKARKEVGSSSSPRHGDFRSAFLSRYRREFGFVIADRPIIVDDIRVRGVAKSLVEAEEEIPARTASDSGPKPVMVNRVTFDGSHAATAGASGISSNSKKTVSLPTRVFLHSELLRDDRIEGPAIIVLDTSTVLITPDSVARITKTGDIRIDIGANRRREAGVTSGADFSGRKISIGSDLDAIQLSIFSHRFMSIAEQMGRVLQRTAISTNIKERLDFSCALFGPDGGLVANAPHIPVHLGAMQETVQYQIKTLGDDIRQGDVILSNHPCAGGSHLPDLTVITPVFHPGAKRPVFFVAARGHHADIGGITPGSMPPHSKSIFEEGAVFKSFKLVREGVFQEAEVTEALFQPSQHPGSSGTRNLADNLSDLRAQVAANQKGIHLVTELINAYGLDVVQAYMGFIQENAELAVRDMLREIASKKPSSSASSSTSFLKAVESMDEGAEIHLRVEIDAETGSAVFDFGATSIEQFGNINAPRAVTLSAVIYCLRCMVGYDVPLNQGCLNPVEIRIPKGSLLDPSDVAAVVGGNVLTSQRIVDVVFKAFSVCAASQGCMNNITFGDGETGYYETVAGGAGAGPHWPGRSGVHSHMTNTRITDPEILERRYPVVLRRFHLRPDSGGVGRFPGGDGVIREMLFRRPLTLSILTERRVFSPYGMAGGGVGAKGRNSVTFADGRKVALSAKTSIDVSAGDAFLLETPGGGGWGKAEGGRGKEEEEEPKKKARFSTMEEKGSVFHFKRLQESA